MEPQSRFDTGNVVSYQHENGERFGADNLEAARKLCPVLGGLSLMEAGLLLELEAMGSEHIDDQNDRPAEKTSAEKHLPDESGKVIIEKELSRAAQTVMPETASAISSISENHIEPFSGKKMHTAVQVHVGPAEEAAVIGQGKTVRPEQNRITAETTIPDLAINATAEPTLMEQIPEVPLRVELSPPENTLMYEERDESIILPAEVYQPAADIVPEVQSVAHESPVMDPLNSESLELPEELRSVSEEQSIDAAVPELLSEGTIMVEAPATSDLDTSAIMDYAQIPESPVLVDPDYYVPDYYVDVEEALEILSNVPSETADDPAIRAKKIHLPAGIPELSAPIAEIESTMMQLSEALMDVAQPEIKSVETILEKIIRLPEIVAVAATEEEELIEEKLEELFIELLDEAGIDYSPQLIESFVRLTKIYYLELIEESEEEVEEELNSLPHEIGTREFLQKLHHGLGTMMQAVRNFYSIGRSIMRLYTSGFDSVPISAE